MTTTLILGGSGFVSGAMARYAHARGDRTFALTRGKRPAPMPPGIIPLTADRNDPAAFASALRGTNFFDLVIDCIGFTATHAQQDLDTIFPPDKPPCTAHLVFLSSDFVCAPDDRPVFIDETFDRFDSSPYGAGKRAAELLLLTQAAARHLPITILRPCHIYGPGSQLGCLPLHGRDAQLLTRLQNREPIKLLGGGHFLQQPLYVDDLAHAAFACPALPLTHGQLYHIAGPDIVESRTFFRLIADILGIPITIEEASITDYLKANPDHRSFCCHRLYTQEKARAHRIPLPTTPLRDGLKKHVASLTAVPD